MNQHNAMEDKSATLSIYVLDGDSIEEGRDLSHSPLAQKLAHLQENFSREKLEILPVPALGEFLRSNPSVEFLKTATPIGEDECLWAIDENGDVCAYLQIYDNGRRGDGSLQSVEEFAVLDEKRSCLQAFAQARSLLDLQPFFEVDFDTINEDLDDPYIDDSTLVDQPVYLADPHDLKPDAIDEFTSLLESAITATMKDNQDGGCHLSVYCADEGQAPHVETDWGPAPVTDWGLSVIQSMLDHYVPTGYKCEYNDGAYDRRSGFSRYPESFYFEMTTPSAIERTAAMTCVMDWIENRLGKVQPDIAASLLEYDET